MLLNHKGDPQLAKILAWLDKGTYNSPLFFYDLDIIDRQIARLKQAFEKYPDFRPLYAVKANNNAKIVTHLAKAGFGMHVSTLREMELALRFASHISFSGPLMTPEVAALARKQQVSLHANTIYDADLLAAHGEIGLRINPGVGSSPHPNFYAGDPASQFGVSLAELAALKPSTRTRITRLHMHTSSDSFHIDLFLQALDVLLVAVSELPAVTAINIGGGMAVPYAEEKVDFDIEAYAQGVMTRLEAFAAKTGRRLTLHVEPGSYLVRQAGYYVCKIYGKAPKQGKMYYYSDGSTHHLKGQPLPIREYATTSTSHQRKAGEVFGASCQRGDSVLEDANMPRLRPGDFVLIADVGAYCHVQACDFNMMGIPGEQII
jgi:diaminopimelate decarboxylase